jgi:hypothetical protein
MYYGASSSRPWWHGEEETRQCFSALSQMDGPIILCLACHGDEGRRRSSDYFVALFGCCAYLLAFFYRWCCNTASLILVGCGSEMKEVTDTSGSTIPPARETAQAYRQRTCLHM